MACLSCVRACSEAFYKVFDQAKSCIQIVEKNGAAKVNTCVQCGKCMRTCKHGAITQNPKTGVYMINKKAVHRLRRMRRGVPDEGHDARAKPLPSASPAASAPRRARWSCSPWRRSKAALLCKKSRPGVSEPGSFWFIYK